MRPPKHYGETGPWYVYVSGTVKEPTKSTFSTDDKGGWKTVCLKRPKGETRTVQGWKLHVCVRADAIKSLFYALSPELRKLDASHKFAIFKQYEANPETGKACVIYPMDPADLSFIVRRVEHVLANMEMLERRGHMAQAKRGKQPDASLAPFPGGVQGDMRVGQSGYIYCRYGGFSGKLPGKNKIYDPVSKGAIEDRRNDVVYPDFIQSIPKEIKALT